MNEKIFNAALEFEKIQTELNKQISLLEIMAEGRNSDKEYLGCHFDSREKMLEVMLKFFKEEPSDNFVTLFGIYCNHYIKYDYHQVLPEKDFGISKLWSVMADENFQEYLSLIREGIYIQQEKSFEDALEIFQEYSLSHLYLFIFAAQKYDLAADEDRTNSDEQKESLAALYEHYNKMNSGLREYALGAGKFVFKSSNLANNRNLLPYVKAVDPYNEFVLYATRCAGVEVFDARSFLGRVLYYFKVLTGKQPPDIEYLCKKLSGATAPRYMIDALLKELFPDDNIKLSGDISTEWRDCRYFFEFNFFEFKLIYLKIPLRISNAGSFLLDQMEKLRLQRERDKIRESKDNLVQDFTHRYKNLQATRLGEIAESLLRMEDEQEKIWGRALLLEQARKETLNKEAAMLNLRYNDRAAELTLLLKKSLANADDGENIADVLQTAFLYCFIEFFYDYDRKDNDAAKMRKNLSQLWNDINDKKISFEREVIFDKKTCIDWFKENDLDLQIDINDERWQKISLQRKNYAEVFLRAIFVEMFKNFLKHGKVMKPLELKFHSDASTLSNFPRVKKLIHLSGCFGMLLFLGNHIQIRTMLTL